MARTRKGRVAPHLVRAQLALGRDEDVYRPQLIEQAIPHRAATIASGQPRNSSPPVDKAAQQQK